MERSKTRSIEIKELEAWVRQSIYLGAANFEELRQSLRQVISSALERQSGPIFHLPIQEELYHLSEYAKAIAFPGQPLNAVIRVNNMAMDITAAFVPLVPCKEAQEPPRKTSPKDGRLSNVAGCEPLIGNHTHASCTR